MFLYLIDIQMDNFKSVLFLFKFVTRQDVEFDQVCLLLKHLLTQNRPMNDNSTQTFVDYFLSYDNQTYVNLLVEKFDASPDLPNVQWMISEIFK